MEPVKTGSKVLDKPISLKREAKHPHIHQYDLHIKVKLTNLEDEEQIVIQQALRKFFEIAIQAGNTSIIPPFLELDKNDKSVPDLSAALQVSGEMLQSHLGPSISFPKFMYRPGNLCTDQGFPYEHGFWAVPQRFGSFCRSWMAIILNKSSR
jgi:hypothetical protein